MPKETFYDPSVVENELPEPVHGVAINVAWGRPEGSPDVPPGVWIAGGIRLDPSGINRLIKTLRKARDQAYPNYLADHQPVPETAFWSPTAGAVSIDGETYTKA